ncbi:MAG: hypothetical protein FWC00_01885 [Firmicutes bacterium]|nr:hypothetical protein [Bacillota bacterium]
MKNDEIVTITPESHQPTFGVHTCNGCGKQKVPREITRGGAQLALAIQDLCEWEALPIMNGDVIVESHIDGIKVQIETDADARVTNHKVTWLESDGVGKELEIPFSYANKTGESKILLKHKFFVAGHGFVRNDIVFDTMAGTKNESETITEDDFETIFTWTKDAATIVRNLANNDEVAKVRELHKQNADKYEKPELDAKDELEFLDALDKIKKHNDEATARKKPLLLRKGLRFLDTETIDV